MSNAEITILYGIPNCDTVKRARAWLMEHGVAHEFHDFKKSGVPPKELDSWVASAGWERLVNRQGLTWKKLPEDQRAAVASAAAARGLMLAQPSVIKRPVVQWASGAVTVGFDAADWLARLKA